MDAPYTELEYRQAMTLVAQRVSDYSIAKQTGISRSTIRRWRAADRPPRSVIRSQLEALWCVEDEAAYCYLLGVYLGDGTVCIPARGSPWLQVVNDRRYPFISGEILDAMRATFPGMRPRTHSSSVGE